MASSFKRKTSDLSASKSSKSRKEFTGYEYPGVDFKYGSSCRVISPDKSAFTEAIVDESVLKKCRKKDCRCDYIDDCDRYKDGYVCPKGQCNSNCRMKKYRSIEEDGPKKVYVAQSTIGKFDGLFAARKLKDGELIMLYAGEVLSTKEAEDRKKEYKKNRFMTCYHTSIDTELNERKQGFTIDCTWIGNEAGKANSHTQFNNCVLRVFTLNGHYEMGLVVAWGAGIDVGEEIFLHYGDNYTDNDGRPVRCSCPEKKFSLCNGYVSNNSLNKCKPLPRFSDMHLLFDRDYDKQSSKKKSDPAHDLSTDLSSMSIDDEEQQDQIKDLKKQVEHKEDKIEKLKEEKRALEKEVKELKKFKNKWQLPVSIIQQWGHHSADQKNEIGTLLSSIGPEDRQKGYAYILSAVQSKKRVMEGEKKESDVYDCAVCGDPVKQEQWAYHVHEQCKGRNVAADQWYLHAKNKKWNKVAIKKYTKMGKTYTEKGNSK